MILKGEFKDVFYLSYYFFHPGNSVDISGLVLYKTVYICFSVSVLYVLYCLFYVLCSIDRETGSRSELDEFHLKQTVKKHGSALRTISRLCMKISNCTLLVRH